VCSASDTEEDGSHQGTDCLPSERLRQSFFLSTDGDVIKGMITLMLWSSLSLIILPCLWTWQPQKCYFKICDRCQVRNTVQILHAAMSDSFSEVLASNPYDISKAMDGLGVGIPHLPPGLVEMPATSHIYSVINQYKAVDNCPNAPKSGCHCQKFSGTTVEG